MGHFKLDTSEINNLLRKFEGMGGDVQGMVETMLDKAAKQIQRDVEAAADKANYPAGGKFSTEATVHSIVRNASVEWNGLVASEPIGFDFGVVGHGGFLISGTPKYAPVQQLHRIFKEISYIKNIQNEMADEVLTAIIDRMVEG